MGNQNPDPDKNNMIYFSIQFIQFDPLAWIGSVRIFDPWPAQSTTAVMVGFGRGNKAGVRPSPLLDTKPAAIVTLMNRAPIKRPCCHGATAGRDRGHL